MVVSFTGGGNPGYHEKDTDFLAGQHQVFVLVPLPFLIYFNGVAGKTHLSL